MPLIELDLANSFGETIGLEWDQVVSEEQALREQIAAIVRDRESGLLPFLDLPEVNPDRLCKVADAARDRFDALVVLGIGGSSLGARAIYEALTTRYTTRAVEGKDRRTLFFNENVDPDELSDLLQSVDWDRTQWNVVTKSGSTIETWSAFLIVWEELNRRFGSEGARERVVVTTDPDRGPLRTFAKEHGLTSFEVPPRVGGRFSVFTPVGLYPLAFAGVDIVALLSGAAQARNRCLRAEALHNPAAVLAALQVLHYRSHRNIVVLMPYARALSSVAEWFCQLWAESLGKRLGSERIGPTPVPAIGVRDQHSQLQLFMEGPADKNILFIETKEFNQPINVPMLNTTPSVMSHLCGKDLAAILGAELAGTRQALFEEGCPSATVKLRALTAESVGALLMLFEVTTAIAGGLFEVDPYNQPGVELGKRYAHGLLGRAKEAHYAETLEVAERSLERRLLTI